MRSSRRKKTRVRPQVRRDAATQSAWEDLFRNYGPLVRGQVCRSLRRAGLRTEQEQIEEREQEVYCRLLMGGSRRLRLLRSYDEKQRAGYLSRVAQRVVLDEVRAWSSVKRGGRLTLTGHLSRIAHRIVETHTPEDEVLLREGRRLVLARCRSLLDARQGTEYRDRSLRILRRALLDGWSNEEIMRAEGGRLAASTIHSLVHRMRRRLVSREGTRGGTREGRYHAGS